MVKEYKRVTKPSSIGSTYAPDLVNKLSDYSKLIGVDRTKIVSSLIAEALEGRILTNDFIELEEPYYFDFYKLIHEGIAEATTEKPVIEPEKIYILKKVPNNLDVKNIKYGTYSFNENKPSFHKGIYYYSLMQVVKPLDNPEDIIEATKDFVLKELSKNLKGYDLEAFIADLLRAMGYRTTLSAHGGDSGIDITAYKDELPPRILVQVKSGDSNIKESTIQSLKGAMREGDYGLFVTLTDYTKNAKTYLSSVPIIKGINGTELVELILKYYNDLSDKYKKMIPLKMVYIPVPSEE